MLTNFKKNLLYIRNKKGFTQEAMAKEFGYTRSLYKEYEYNKQPDIEFLMKISKDYGVSINDLMEQDLEELETMQAQNKLEIHNFNHGLRILAVSVDEDKKENVEFVPVKAKAGYLAGYSDPHFIVNLKRLSLPLPSSGTFRAFEIEGDSMPPHKPGSIVIGKYIDSMNELINLKTYVIITKSEGISYKRVINKIKEKGHLVLMSDNPVYQPYMIKGQEILEVWEYYCHIGFDGKEEARNIDDRLLSKIDDLSLEIADLNNLVRQRLLPAA